MKRHLLAWILSLSLLPTGVVLAQAKQTGDDGRTMKEAADQGVAKREKRSSGRSKTPAKSFKPTERIRADSAVSFPVDI